MILLIYHQNCLSCQTPLKPQHLFTVWTTLMMLFGGLFNGSPLLALMSRWLSITMAVTSMLNRLVITEYILEHCIMSSLDFNSQLRQGIIVFTGTETRQLFSRMFVKR